MILVINLPLHAIKKILKLFGLKIIKEKVFISMKKKLSDVPKFVKLWNRLDNDKKKFISPYLHLSTSQFAQDLFVISETSCRYIPKYFVEFGAASGYELSNTYLLEKYFSWNGILSEPAKIWHQNLKENRTCIIDTRCVYTKTGEKIMFCETNNANDEFKKSGPELSRLKKYNDSVDWATEIRKQNSTEYLVESISLNDLLLQQNAPSKIGYLSIDTEGGEFEILESFDFSNYRIEIISVEHNYDLKKRGMIDSLLTDKGYVLKYENTFGADDIYILKDPIAIDSI